jgi:hypothetical protein
MPTLPTSPTGLADYRDGCSAHEPAGRLAQSAGAPRRPVSRRRSAANTFRATGITAYLSNGGALEHAQEMAAHESPRTTKLYDRTKERLTRTDQVVNSRITVKHGARSPAHD